MNPLDRIHRAFLRLRHDIGFPTLELSKRLDDLGHAISAARDPDAQVAIDRLATGYGAGERPTAGEIAATPEALQDRVDALEATLNKTILQNQADHHHDISFLKQQADRHAERLENLKVRLNSVEGMFVSGKGQDQALRDSIDGLEAKVKALSTVTSRLTGQLNLQHSDDLLARQQMEDLAKRFDTVNIPALSDRVA